MRVFFGTLRVMLSQISYDVYTWFHDLFIRLRENLHDILKRLVVVIGVIVTILFDAWIFWMLKKWAEHPVVITFVIMGSILLVFLQIGAWIDRKKIYNWFLNRWSRASQVYRHRR
jgi:mannose/fructose/N-acetylgalactosamine-specific phosphotransferase system component IID